MTAHYKISVCTVSNVKSATDNVINSKLTALLQLNYVLFIKILRNQMYLCLVQYEIIL